MPHIGRGLISDKKPSSR